MTCWCSDKVNAGRNFPCPPGTCPNEPKTTAHNPRCPICNGTGLRVIEVTADHNATQVEGLDGKRHPLRFDFWSAALRIELCGCIRNPPASDVEALLAKSGV